jgi:hypothetical protein
MHGRNIFLGISSLFLIAAIPVAVYLASQQQTLRSRAYSVDSTPSIRISGPQVIDYKTSSADVSLVINYPKSSLVPDSFRVANYLPDLEQATVQTFTAPTQIIPWRLETNTATPTVYLQFRINNQWQTPIFTSIPFLASK